MKKSIKAIILGLFIVPAMLFAMPATIGAQSVDNIETGVGQVANDTCLFSIPNDPNTTADESCTGMINNLINYSLIAVGAIAVIMLIYGGIRYTISAGDAKQVEAAKNTIMYAIIGLVVVLLAGAIVRFVLGAF